MRRGEIWFAATLGGDRPVLIPTRDPVADLIGSIVVAALTRTKRSVISDLDLTSKDDVVRPTASSTQCLPAAPCRALARADA